MADILIRGMEMPKTCCQCDLKIYDPEMRWDENGIKQIGAWVCKRTREIIWNTQRGENCPLIPLPEGHGRLIDGTDLYSTLDGGFDVDLDDLPETKDAILGMIAQADTIVPAEGGISNG